RLAALGDAVGIAFSHQSRNQKCRCHRYRQKPRHRAELAAVTLKLPSGDVVLREPYLLCDTPSCRIEIGNFNLKDVIKDARQAIMSGGPALCAVTKQCRDSVADYAADALNRISAGTSTSPPK